MDEKIEFLLKNIKEFTRNLILRFYPFNLHSLSKYKDIISLNEWDIVTENSNILWNEELINTFFRKNRYWYRLIINIPWSKELLKLYSDEVIWSLIEDTYFWDSDYSTPVWIESIFYNTHIFWDKEWINLFQNNIDWVELSEGHNVSWTVEIIDLYKNKWDWVALSRNESIHYTDEMISRFYDHWDWQWLSLNKRFLQNTELFSKYYNKLTYDKQRITDSIRKKIIYGYSCEYLNYTNEEINQNSHLVDWPSLSSNKIIKWTEDFITKNFDKFDWIRLATNSAVPWNDRLFHIFKNIYVKKNNSYSYEISRNGQFPWSIDLIAEYQDLFDIKGLSNNRLVWERVFKECINDNNLDDFLIMEDIKF